MPNDKITPAAFDPAERPTLVSVASSATEQKSERPYLAIGILGSLVIAAATVLLLPKFLGGPDPSNMETQTADSTTTSNGVAAETSVTANTTAPQADAGPPASQTPTASPWAETQQQNARRESQEILSKLVDAQRQLASLSAEKWAQSELESIGQLALEGDKAYQERDYTKAIELYNSALTSAEGMIDSSSDTALQYFRRGSEELEANRVSSAVQNLELAVLLDSGMTEAQDLLNRAQVRQSVLDLESDAEKQIREQNLEGVKQSYLAIQKLDPEYADITQRIADIEAQILDRDYRKAMSQGYANLSAGRLSEAEIAFRQAGKLKPSSDAIAQALQQVEASRINDERQSQLDRAIALEAGEQWAEALGIYSNLSAADPSLTSAKLGKLRTEARAALDEEIEAVLAEPLQLQSEQAWRQASKVLTDAKNVIDRGPVLTSQIQELDNLIRVARTKVTVELFSDSQTHVEIYRMGELGQFREHAVALYPGRYVLVGTRSGYRDVREELVLDGSQMKVELSIQCTETI